MWPLIINVFPFPSPRSVAMGWRVVFPSSQGCSTDIMSTSNPAQTYGNIECCQGNECVSKQHQGHITDHFWYENEEDPDDIICVYCLQSMYGA